MRGRARSIRRCRLTKPEKLTMTLPSRLSALRPIAAIVSASAVVLATSPSSHPQTPPSAPDSQQWFSAARVLQKNELPQIHSEALANDATYAASRYQQQASQELVPQARSGLLPNLGLSANENQFRPDGTHEVFVTDSSGNVVGVRQVDVNNPFNSYGGGVSLTIPVYRPQNWQQFEQGKISVAAAALTLLPSEQRSLL